MADERFSWAKVYCDLPRDPKFIGRSAHDCWLWVCLILLARESDKPGIIPAFQANVAYLSQYSRIKAKEVEDAIAYFRGAEMIVLEPEGCITLLHFDKRQRRKPSDSAASVSARVQRHRNANVTPLKRGGNAPETRSLARAREETDRNPIGLLTETEAEAESAREFQQAAEELYGPGPAVAAARERDFEDFWATYRELAACPIGAKEDAERAYEDHVPPGVHVKLLEHVRHYFASDELREINPMTAANFLRQWEQWDAPRKSKRGSAKPESAKGPRLYTPAEIAAAMGEPA